MIKGVNKNCEYSVKLSLNTPSSNNGVYSIGFNCNCLSIFVFIIKYSLNKTIL